jgi:DNA polymerase I
VFKPLILIGWSEESATKKRYVGRLVWNEGKFTNEIAFTGLEAVRSDWIDYTQHLQHEVAEHICDDDSVENIVALLKKHQEEVMGGKLSAESISITQGLQKSLRDYASTPPHVRVAQKMAARGMQLWQGIKIPYIVRDKLTHDYIHLDEFDGTYDALFYWNKKIFPAIYRVVKSAFPKYKWEELVIKQPLMKSKQKEKLTQWF